MNLTANYRLGEIIMCKYKFINYNNTPWMGDVDNGESKNVWG